MNIDKYQKAGTQYATSASLFAGLLVTLTLGGCTSNSTTRIDARDSSVVVKELRMAYNYDKEKEAALLHTGHAIEVGVTNTSGSADQSLTSGQLPVIINRVVFNGPQQIKNDFDFSFYELSWRYSFISENKFGMEFSAGAGYSSIDIKSSSSTQMASQRFESHGARVESGLLYLISPSSSVQARAKLFWAPFQPAGANSISRLEIVYAKAFFNNFNLRAGFARWQASGHNDQSFLDSTDSTFHPSSSDFRLDFSGPILALDLAF